MKKKLLSLVLAMACIVNTSSFVNAQEIGSVDGDEASVVVDSNFTVQPGDLSQVIISVPTNLDLEREGNFTTKYSVEDAVSARGTLASNRVVAVCVDSSITYEDSVDATNKVTATVDFSRGLTKGFQYWTPTELEASNTNLDSRAINIEASTDKAGDFSGEVTFKAKAYSVYGSLTGASFTDFTDYALCSLSGSWDGETIPAFYGIEDGGNTKILPVQTLSISSAPTSLTSFTCLPTFNQFNILGAPNLRTLELNDNLYSLSIKDTPVLDWTSLVIPKSVRSLQIDENSTLTSVGYTGDNNVALDTLESVNMDSFRVKNATVTRIKVPFKAESVSFMDCTALEEVVFEDTVELGFRCFYNCGNLETLDLTNVTLFSQDCGFSGCTSLQKIYLSDKCVDFAYAGTSSPSYSGFSGLASTVEIYYNNTMARFKATKGYSITESRLNGNVVHCTDGDIIL